MNVRGYMNITLQVPFSSEVDPYEFDEWSEGANMDSDALSEFIQAHRDWPLNVECSVANGNIHPVIYTEIERVLEPR